MSRRPRPTRPSAIAFTATILAAIGLTVVYTKGGQPQIEGSLLAVAFGGLAVGLVFWAKRLMPHGPQAQRRDVIPSQVAERSEAEESFEEGAERIGRRRFLGRMLALAGAAVGVALVIPVRSLGERPGSSLFHTLWRPGSRVVTDAGQPVLAADLPANTELTVFPEGGVGDAESQTLLIRLPPGDYHPLPGREDWAPDDIVAFSKVCTHAGCPVGLYRADTMELYCPCHQSVFEVLHGAEPSEGPATRPLPQLPLMVDADGYLVAQSDFTEPIGPGFWNRDRRG